MKVLIYGHQGWIGKQVVELLKNKNHTVILGTSRVENKFDVENEIIKTKPSNIMSFIGRTHGKIDTTEYTTIDYLEQKGKIYENVRDNLFSPVVLALLSKKHNIHFTYLGTGCIFQFDEQHPFGEEVNGFTEYSIPNFFNSSYSVVKGFTDELMHLLNENSLNVRIRMPITNINNPRNFITKITNYKKICSVPNSMTVLPELLPIMIDMAERTVTGTVNLTNPGLISHNEILTMYKKYVDPTFEWSNFSIEEQNEILAAGRSNNFLDTTLLTSLYPNVKNIKDAVREMLVNYKK
jgi:nucleoside-diphosphate-sugar epimerase